MEFYIIAIVWCVISLITGFSIGATQGYRKGRLDAALGYNAFLQSLSVEDRLEIINKMKKYIHSSNKLNLVKNNQIKE